MRARWSCERCGNSATVEIDDSEMFVGTHCGLLDVIIALSLGGLVEDSHRNKAPECLAQLSELKMTPSENENEAEAPV